MKKKIIYFMFEKSYNSFCNGSKTHYLEMMLKMLFGEIP